MGRGEEASIYLKKSLDIDGLSYGIQFEGYLLAKTENEEASETVLEELRYSLRGGVQSYLELALDYLEYGLYEEAEIILKVYIKDQPLNEVYPMVYYILAYILQGQDRSTEVKEYLELASIANSDYCFPHRLWSYGLWRLL